jgi:hypothetical protein
MWETKREAAVRNFFAIYYRHIKKIEMRVSDPTRLHDSDMGDGSVPDIKYCDILGFFGGVAYVGFPWPNNVNVAVTIDRQQSKQKT